MMDRFLIIGASGFIGGHLGRYIARQRNVEVLGTRRTPGDDHLISFDLARDDIRESLPPAWRVAGENAWAILAAAVVPMDRCATDRDLARAVMIDGSQRCLDQLVEMGYAPVLISTSYVFDGARGGYREDDAPAPISHYGGLKLELERYLGRTHPRALVARLDKIVGSDPGDPHLFSEWHRRAVQRRPIVCIQDQVFGPTLVDDVAAILHQACRRRLEGIYHLANPEPIARDDLARRFLAACGLQAAPRIVPLESLGLPEPRPLRSWLRADKIRGELNVEFTTAAETLRRFHGRLSQHLASDQRH